MVAGWHLLGFVVLDLHLVPDLVLAPSTDCCPLPFARRRLGLPGDHASCHQDQPHGGVPAS